MTQDELSGFIREAHARLGVAGSGGPSFGPSSSFPHGSRKRKNLENGDVILVDGGCRVEGYSSDVTRSLVFGQATDQQKKSGKLSGEPSRLPQDLPSRSAL